MDFPTAWVIARATPIAEHDPACSYALANGGFLCDCRVLHRHPQYLADYGDSRSTDKETPASCDLLAVPGLTIDAAGPGGFRITHAEQTIRIPLALIPMAPDGAFVLLDDKVRILSQVYYQVTGWDPAAYSLICNRLHTVMEIGRRPLTPEQARARRAGQAEELRRTLPAPAGFPEAAISPAGAPMCASTECDQIPLSPPTENRTENRSE